MEREGAPELATGTRRFVADHLAALRAYPAETSRERALRIVETLTNDIAVSLRAEARAITAAASRGALPVKARVDHVLEELPLYRAGDAAVRRAWAWHVLEKRIAEAEGVLMSARLAFSRARPEAAVASGDLAAAARAFHALQESRARLETALRGALLPVLDAWARAIAGAPPAPAPEAAVPPFRPPREALAAGAPDGVAPLLGRALGIPLAPSDVPDVVAAWRLLDAAEAHLEPTRR